MTYLQFFNKNIWSRKLVIVIWSKVLKKWGNIVLPRLHRRCGIHGPPRSLGSSTNLKAWKATWSFLFLLNFLRFKEKNSSSYSCQAIVQKEWSVSFQNRAKRLLERKMTESCVNSLYSIITDDDFLPKVMFLIFQSTLWGREFALYSLAKNKKHGWNLVSDWLINNV